ncbi:MAG: hypothetical protein CMJ25_27945 [Phycisphaerae bacterium]|jgi:hypothetical protein|nr:hypothetical protein [Phycisphaerae bacterium]
MITELKEVIIEEQTYSGSAFGVTEQGDGVFFNSRIVDAVGLKAGQTVQACLVPNFPDKRESIPWRAMRVEVTHDGLNIITQENAPLNLNEKIHRLLKEDDGHWTLTELAEELDEDTEVVRTVLINDKSIMSTLVYFM